MLAARLLACAATLFIGVYYTRPARRYYRHVYFDDAPRWSPNVKRSCSRDGRSCRSAAGQVSSNSSAPSGPASCQIARVHCQHSLAGQCGFGTTTRPARLGAATKSLLVFAAHLRCGTRSRHNGECSTARHASCGNAPTILSSRTQLTLLGRGHSLFPLSPRPRLGTLLLHQRERQHPSRMLTHHVMIENATSAALSKYRRTLLIVRRQYSSDGTLAVPVAANSRARDNCQCTRLSSSPASGGNSPCCIR